jgi:hypothetical protein
MRLTGVTSQPESSKLDWAVAAAAPKVQRIVERLAAEAKSYNAFAQRLTEIFPKVENDISIRAQLQKLPALGRDPAPGELEALLVEMSDLMSKMSPDALGEQEKLLLLVSKIHPAQWRDMRAERRDRERCNSFDELLAYWRERVTDDALERYLYAQAKGVTKEKIHLLGEQPEAESSGKGGKGKGQSRGRGKGKGQGPDKPPRQAEASFKAKIT